MRIASLVFAAVLSGCAVGPTLNAQGWALIEQGDYASAEAVLLRAVQQGDVAAWNSLGVSHIKRGNRDKAIQYYNMGARWGDTYSQQNLIDLGQPVPAPDLAQAKAQRNANQAQAMRDASMFLLRPAPPLAPPTQIQCTTNTFGTMARTTCN